MRDLKWTIVGVSLALIFGLGSIEAKEWPKARLARELSDYSDVLMFKSQENPIFVQEDDAEKIKYGSFADDDNPQDAKPWNVFDLLYEDVPVVYESALSLMAKSEWKQALDLLEKCEGENTQVSKKTFRSTDIYRNYLPHKQFLCYFNLGDTDKALEVFEKIEKNSSAHSRVRVMIDALPMLIEKENGRVAEKVVTELSALKLPRKDTIDIALNRCLVQAINKKYSEAKSGLDSILEEYGEDYSNLAGKVEDIKTSILVYYEKNYGQAIKYFEDTLSESREKASSDMYIKLGFCYSKVNKWEEARWNYLQGYLIGSFNKSQLLHLLEKVEEANGHIPSKESSVALVEFFEKVKKAL